MLRASTIGRPINVLVADHNSSAIEQMVGILSKDPDIHVIGYARISEDVLRKVRMYKPDLIAMGIGIAMNGEGDLLQQVMNVNPSRILVLTGPDDEGHSTELKSKGALETIPYPGTGLTSPDAVTTKIKFLAGVHVIFHPNRRGEQVPACPPEDARRHFFLDSQGILAIAASTGGPKALHAFLSSLAPDFPVPIVIAQHIDKDFVPLMADWLNQHAALHIKVAEDGERLGSGNAYLAPSHCHMAVSRHRRIEFRPKQPADIYSPSCDVLLESAADVFGDRCVGIILTGMGGDGARGMMRIKKAGGLTIAQDEATSLIFGMPKVAIDSGCVDRVLGLHEISHYIQKMIK